MLSNQQIEKDGMFSHKNTHAIRHGKDYWEEAQQGEISNEVAKKLIQRYKDSMEMASRMFKWAYELRQNAGVEDLDVSIAWERRVSNQIQNPKTPKNYTDEDFDVFKKLSHYEELKFAGSLKGLTEEELLELTKAIEMAVDIACTSWRIFDML